MRKTGEDRICETCGAGFHLPGWRIRRSELEGRFCSSDCFGRSRLGIASWNAGVLMERSRPEAAMTQAEIGWLAGIIEGEGSLRVQRRAGKRASLEIAVNMTDHDVVRRLRDVTGVGTVYGPYCYNGYKPFLRWHVNKRKDIARVLLAVAPLMGERRKQRMGEMAGAIRELEGLPAA